MKRRLGAALAALIALLVIAGCGGTKTVTVKPSPPPAPAFVVAGGHCAKAPADSAAICQLRNQPPALSLGSPLGVPELRGLDGWGPPSLQALSGYQFGAAYLSTDPSKNWSPSSVAAYRRAGKGIVMTWETYATRAGAGYDAGVYDAVHASQQASADGARGAPIDAAVDFDATCGQITPYFQGWHTVLGSRAGVYGGYDQVACVYRQGLVGHQNWQTYAWSSGRWLSVSIAPLEQWLNGTTYDQDRALSGSYGQAFQTAPKPTDPYAILDHTKRRFVFGAQRVVMASEYNTVRTGYAHGCRRPLRRAVCKSSDYHLRILRGRLITVSTREHPHYKLKGQGARQTIMAKAEGRW